MGPRGDDDYPTNISTGWKFTAGNGWIDANPFDIVCQNCSHIEQLNTTYSIHNIVYKLQYNMTGLSLSVSKHFYKSLMDKDMAFNLYFMYSYEDKSFFMLQNVLYTESFEQMGNEVI